MESTMNTKLHEMMALAASYAVNCHPCLEYHKQKAEEAGLTEAEMLQAIRVGEMVRKGAHKKTKDKANTLFGNVDEVKCGQQQQKQQQNGCCF